MRARTSVVVRLATVSVQRRKVPRIDQVNAGRYERLGIPRRHRKPVRGGDLAIRDSDCVTSRTCPRDQYREQTGGPCIEDQHPPFAKRVDNLTDPRLQPRPPHPERH
jgi:hypothetical protein